MKKSEEGVTINENKCDNIYGQPLSLIIFRIILNSPLRLFINFPDDHAIVKINKFITNLFKSNFSNLENKSRVLDFLTVSELRI